MAGKRRNTSKRAEKRGALAGPLLTPDRRYLVIDGRLWRTTNPVLGAEKKEALVRELMSARRAVNAALKAEDEAAERASRRRVHKAKVSLGERGAVWWSDGAPDYNRRLIKNTPYADWHASRA